jgi:type II secretory pathway pseudopilin PulG
MPPQRGSLSITLLWRKRGATLLELLLAIAMVTVVVSTLALFFPKASKSITTNRRQYLANNFAASHMQDMKNRPYSYIPLTDAITANFPGGVGINGCDCNTANFNNLPTEATYIEDGISYVLKTCVNLVERNNVTGAWTTFCPDGTPATDKGLKRIKARVSWTFINQSFTTDIESLVIR